jgi:hypothetical protein
MEPSGEFFTGSARNESNPVVGTPKRSVPPQQQGVTALKTIEPFP